MKEWIEDAKKDSYSSKFTIEGSRMIRLLIAEIERLEKDYKDHTKILGDKLNDQIEYLKQDRETIKQLQRIVACAKECEPILEKSGAGTWIIDLPTLRDIRRKHKKLQQALAAKGE